MRFLLSILIAFAWTAASCQFVTTMSSSIPVTGTTYYVDEDGYGNNGNPGTEASPWATLAYAVTQVSAGDLIYMMEGSHTMSNTNIPVKISIRGVDSATTIINLTNSTNYQPGWAFTSDPADTDGDCEIYNLAFDGGDTSWNAIYIAGRSNIRIHHCKFTDFDDCGIIFNGRVGMGDTGDPGGTYCSGNRFYNNTVIDCTEKSGANSGGALRFGVQEDFKLYNCYFREDSNADAENGYPIKYYATGYIKNIEIFNNTIIKPPASTSSGVDWNFCMELWNYEGAVRIHHNTIHGSIDIGNAITAIDDTIASIHHNIFGYDTLPNEAASRNNAAVFFEGYINRGGIYVERNEIKNIGSPFQIYPRDCTQIETYIRYNVIYGLGGYDAGDYERLLVGSATESGGNIRLLYFDNNTVTTASEAVGGGDAPDYGFHFPEATDITFDSIYIRNNILVGFEDNPIYSNLSGGAGIDYLWEENNQYYGNGTNAANHAGNTPTNYTNQNHQTTDPDFYSSPTDLHVGSGSDAVDGGKSIGLLRDYEWVTVGTPPNIGALETTKD